ncbi:hypothetical protein M6B38_393045 [Iris pallida]|uniref:Uncharacterized protein n=1 Tax=Iris pallida TaxID=29817 RepID=A0AAX6FZ91_IRIPA|nr:hypothetical protein M6B38_393045 [Iris pallida]
MESGARRCGRFILCRWVYCEL